MRLNEIKIYCIIFISIGFLLTVPAFYQGVIVSDDFLIHLNWHSCFSAQFISGEWYPRWLMDMNGGRGSPVFFFYPPLAYYASALIEYFLPASSPQWFAIYLSFGLALSLSGLTSFLLLQNYTQSKWAFIIALFYMIAPYHLFVDFYHRFAYSEFWAFAWTPLVLYFLIGVLNDRINSTYGLIFSYALLLITHLPTIIMLTPIIVLYTIYNTNDYKYIFKIIFYIVCSFFVTSFYVIPMLFYQKYINIDTMFYDGFNYFNNFFFSNNGFENSYYLNITIYNLLLISILSLIVLKKSSHKSNIFWIIAGFTSIFLMFRPSYFIWYLVPFLNKIQFPWRFNQITLIAIIILTAKALNYSNKEFLNKRLLLMILAAFIITIQVVSVGMKILPLHKRNLSQEEMARFSHETKAKLGTLEYIPKWPSDLTLSSIKYRDLDTLENEFIVYGEADVSVLSWSSRMIKIRSSSEKYFIAIIRQFYFPGWQVTLNDENKKIIKTTPSQDGLIRFVVPPGQHIINARLVEMLPEIIGKYLSITTIITIFISFLYNYCGNLIMRKSKLL